MYLPTENPAKEVDKDDRKDVIKKDNTKLNDRFRDFRFKTGHQQVIKKDDQKNNGNLQVILFGGYLSHSPVRIVNQTEYPSQNDDGRCYKIGEKRIKSHIATD